MLRVAERQSDRYEPRLGAVVEVALEPAALLVAGRDDPGTRCLDLVELAAQLDAQARDLDREPGGLDTSSPSAWCRNWRPRSSVRDQLLRLR
jgi:hypothetical protein